MSLMKSQGEEAAGLWAPEGAVVASQLAVFAVLLITAVSNLAGESPTEWQRFLGLAAALVSGLALGNGASLYRQRRMVRLHMASQHPGVPVPTNPRG